MIEENVEPLIEAYNEHNTQAGHAVTILVQFIQTRRYHDQTGSPMTGPQKTAALALLNAQRDLISDLNTTVTSIFNSTVPVDSNGTPNF